MYNFINWVLDHVFPHRMSRDKYLIHTYLEIGTTNCNPSLKNGSRYVAGVYLDFLEGMDIYKSAIRNGVTVEEIQAAIAYMRRHPEYAKEHMGWKSDFRTRTQWKMLLLC